MSLNFLIIVLVTMSLGGEATPLDTCDSDALGGVTVPPKNATLEHVSSYPYVGSALQIFPELCVQCDGFLTEWHFISRNQIVYGLHLAVFRMINDSSLVLVGENYLKAFSTAGPSHRVLYKPPDPIEVQRGDILGVIYDDLHSPTELLTIPAKVYVGIPRVELDFAPSYVYFLNYTQLRSELNGVLPVQQAIREFRKPALTAFVSKQSTMPAVFPVVEPIPEPPAASDPSFYQPRGPIENNNQAEIDALAQQAVVIIPEPFPSFLSSSNDQANSNVLSYGFPQQELAPKSNQPNVPIFVDSNNGGLVLQNSDMSPTAGSEPAPAEVPNLNFNENQKQELNSNIPPIVLTIPKPQNYDGTFLTQFEPTTPEPVTLARSKKIRYRTTTLPASLPTPQNSFVDAEPPSAASSNPYIMFGGWMSENDPAGQQQQLQGEVPYVLPAEGGQQELALRDNRNHDGTVIESGRFGQDLAPVIGPVTHKQLIYPQRCLNPPIASNQCRVFRTRAFFDFTKNSCTEFFGCEADNSDANNFDSVDQCEVYCHFTPPETTPPPSFIFPECFQAPTFSNCFFPTLRYYYDAGEQRCKSFLGCQPSNFATYNGQVQTNNFESLQDCSTRCGAGSELPTNAQRQHPKKLQLKSNKNQQDQQTPFSQKLENENNFFFLNQLQQQQQQQQQPQFSSPELPNFFPNLPTVLAEKDFDKLGQLAEQIRKSFSHNNNNHDYNNLSG